MNKTDKADKADSPAFGLIVIGDEIMSGKRADKHFARAVELLGERGLALAWAEYVGDAPARIVDVLRRAFASSDAVFCCGGIGTTPDDRTRQCAAQALGVPLQLHPQAAELIRQRLREVAEKEGRPWEPQRPDNVQRLQMGVLPQGAGIVPNAFNRIPGFSCRGPGGGAVYFFPGFPVMTWPMMAWVLDEHYAHLRGRDAQTEKSVLVFGCFEAALTPLMEALEEQHPRIRVFSLPSMEREGDRQPHIELGIKGQAEAVAAAWPQLLAGLQALDARLGEVAERTIGA